MAKKIRVPLVVGDKVKLKGRTYKGVLAVIYTGKLTSKWCEINYDANAQGPKIVHLDELDRDEYNDTSKCE